MAAAPTHHRPTYQAKEPFARSWFIAGVEGQPLGRAATKIADVLRGKHRPTFTSHADAGDFVVVVNAEKVRLTGKKWTIKLYRDHSLFPGGLATQTAEQLIKRHPTDLVKRAVWGMLPKGPLGRRIYKKLKVYAGADHPPAPQHPRPRNSKPDVTKAIYATGRRKHAVARVWLQPGSGKIAINNRSLEDYFGRETSRMVFRQALELTETSGRFDVFVNVRGGGLSGQADAIRHGISRSLTKIDPAFRGALKKAGYLTRDARAKERKKYGPRGARARFQSSRR